MYFKNKEVTPYRIHELHQRGGLGGAAFDIFLNGEFANKARNIKLSDIKTDFMMEGATDILKSLGNRESQGLYFYKDTMLLSYCCVDGSACRIGVSNMYIEQDIYDRPLDYAPHNIDTSIQAYGLLSLWLHWFKCAEIVLKINASEQAVQADTESRCPDMEHKHIATTHEDWAPRNYQCVCGFKTGDRIEFDNHLKEKSNEALNSKGKGQ